MGGAIWGKAFIMFGREGGMGDLITTSVFQHQNDYLQEAKQSIVQNLSDIDEVIEIETNEEEDEDMEGTATTLMHIFLQYLDKQGPPLFKSIEQTSTDGIHRFIFNKSKADELDTMLSRIDNNLGKTGQWDKYHTHYRYLPSTPVTAIVSIPRSRPTMFRVKHLAVFQSGPIPGEIVTAKPKRN
jgi:hypothetical protein